MESFQQQVQGPGCAMALCGSVPTQPVRIWCPTPSPALVMVPNISDTPGHTALSSCMLSHKTGAHKSTHHTSFPREQGRAGSEQRPSCSLWCSLRALWA